MVGPGRSDKNDLLQHSRYPEPLFFVRLRCAPAFLQTRTPVPENQAVHYAFSQLAQTGSCSDFQTVLGHDQNEFGFTSHM